MQDFIDKEREEGWFLVQLKKRKRKFVISIIISVIVIGLLGMCILIGHRIATNAADEKIMKLEMQLYELQNTPQLSDTITPQIVLDVLSERVSDISELASAKYLLVYLLNGLIKTRLVTLPLDTGIVNATPAVRLPFFHTGFVMVAPDRGRPLAVHSCTTPLVSVRVAVYASPLIE